MKSTAVSLALLLATVGVIVELVAGQPCTSKQLSVFNEVSGQVNRCGDDSKVSVQMPPSGSLSKEQQQSLCKSNLCQDMIGSVDDLDLPRCETLFDGKNVTLQESLDKFTATCDAVSPAPKPIKRPTSSGSSSSASSASSGSASLAPQEDSAGTAVRFGRPQLFASLATVGFSTMVAML